ncbi:glycoside hydrolase family 97 protein [Psychrosphaera aquimarina]|uniref:Glycoside hydrolase family 97 protein n=1 Tax=Psychrosphaera aquimarina TaxID=2044854 RepID=A0ABU3QY31_9GAMM|nr:glycoside hydrolase family 97 protein [Psychrosphaera aquimarina]MDU0112344.1 glycoside hydrolase family 97 protein [Psychrosphaera aquimarina]
MKIILLLLISCSFIAHAQTLQVTSPNGKLKVSISDDNNQPQYSASFGVEQIIEPSALGLVFKQQAAFTDGFKIVNTTKGSNDTSWELPWGERRVVTDKYNELLVELHNSELIAGNKDSAGTYSVRIRVFDDGFGFRYEVPKQSGYEQVEIVKESTEFALNNADKTTAWWIPARGWNRYEYVYNETPVYQAQHVHTPVTFKTDTGIHLSIHEAALVDYAAMTLNQRRPGRYVADLTPWYDGIAVKTQTDFTSPWRTIQVSKDAKGLLNSDLILNLNEPNKLGDVSWVNPGKYVGIWWEMHVNKSTWGSGDKHGATTDNTKHFMDFAAKYGFDGVLVEGWNIGWDGDWFFNGDVFSFTENYDDFDIKQLTQYGAEKGVKLIGHHETSGNVTNYREQMQGALDLYAELDVEQIKTGYVADGGNIKRIDKNGIVRKEWHDGQFMVNEYLYNITEAAKRKISINTHEPVKDTGLRRTYPNWIAREGARGQEFNAWGTPPNPPEHMPTLAFTRMLSGPMDFTPGIFDMSFNGLGDKTNRPQTTLAKQLASYVVLYSPIQMAADLPENYEAKLDAFQFIVDVPTDWEESIALAGEVGDFVVFARKARATERYSGDDWFLGAITNNDARSLDIDLTFLDTDKKYEAQIYRDGDKAEWKHNPYDYVIEKKVVSSTDKLTLKLASSGGTAIRFKAL